jgi:wyosine [tRNA(Phe)-imidazoG37] synthetase (radical SAM superfamily)
MLSEDIFLKGMAVLMSLYPDYNCTSETVDAYREFLRHLEPEEFERAVQEHVTRSKWFPKVSEILAAARAHLPTPVEVWAS